MGWAIREENRVREARGVCWMQNWGRPHWAGNHKHMLWGDAPEGLPESGHRRCSEGSSVGSLLEQQRRNHGE